MFLSFFCYKNFKIIKHFFTPFYPCLFPTLLYFFFSIKKCKILKTNYLYFKIEDKKTMGPYPTGLPLP